VAIGKISIDTTHRAVPLRQLSFLYVLKVASIDGLMPSLVARHCTVFLVNLVFRDVLGK